EAAEAAEADPFATTTQPGTPWGFTDVFAADVDGAIGRELGDAAAEPDPVEDGRSLADVFALEAAFRTLGLEPGAPWDEVVLAHRRIAKRCHPDRLVHADDETRRRGEQEMIDANAAYERLRAQQRPSPHSSGLFTR
ncbi:MAG: J domain-containing protein, partial [Acidimicrobiales bacterium]|nr:J domain-containing protein [Acidimicrobiales bacterium]